MSLSDIGQRLRDRRVELGLSLRDAEAATKIRERYLEAIEGGDDSILPGHVYAKGFIKSYGNFLGLDGNELAVEYEAVRGSDSSTGVRRSTSWSAGRRRSSKSTRRYRRPIPQEISVARTDSRSRAHFRTGGIVLLVLLALLAAVGIYMLYVAAQTELGADNGDKDISPDPADEVVTDHQDPISGGGEPDVTTPGDGPADDEASDRHPDTPSLELESQSGDTTNYVVTADRVAVQVTVTQRCWVRVEADGHLLHEATLLPGTSFTWEADEKLTILAGYPGGLEMVVGDTPVTIEQPGTPQTFVFKREF